MKDEIVFLQRSSIPINGKLTVVAITKKGVIFHGEVTPQKDTYGRYIIPKTELTKLRDAFLREHTGVYKQ